MTLVHAAVSTEIAALAQYNIDKVLEIAERIVDICRQPISFESILQRLFSEFGLNMSYEQYVLVGSTVHSYLSWLKDTNRIRCGFEENMMLWERA